MENKFRSESEIEDLVRLFETATIGRDEWRHAEHLVVALHYLNLHDIETATAKMRDGIFKLLRVGFAVDLTKEMPYHETLTIFWMHAVADFSSTRSSASMLDRANELVTAYDKDYPLKFYSREYLFSDELRQAFAPGDLAEYASAKPQVEQADL